ncbi:non-homologous end-joining DNA ligase [bacterium]|nr:non-homologous end-joining DNA ligase [bacterium]MCI0605831.1 non-homologous end-joining DNA ligase [bacterium]
MKKIKLPKDQDNVIITVGDRSVALTNLRKIFWKKLGITKGDLIQYYIDVSSYLLPHLAGRAMVMKRYPNGAESDFFYMKRAPVPRPAWIKTCRIYHGSGNVIDFPIVGDLPTLMWIINLGCIDLNPWYSRCDDTDRPDFLHFDLDPTPGATFEQLCEAALVVRDTLDSLKIPCYAKTTGSRGIHVYIPIHRNPTQKEVWYFAKSMAQVLANNYSDLLTAEYRVAKRPPKRVLVDYNQNAWGRTLASIYSIRPTARATVSTPVKWEEIEAGIKLEDFRIDNVPKRLAITGDLWKPLLGKRRVNLTDYSL